MVILIVLVGADAGARDNASGLVFMNTTRAFSNTTNPSEKMIKFKKSQTVPENPKPKNPFHWLEISWKICHLKRSCLSITQTARSIA